MRVMYVASEATPFIKSGGLADVIGSLPKETAKKDVESIVVIPKYQDMKFVDQIEYVTNFDIYMGWRKRYCGIFKAEVDGVTFYFIDNEQYFGRPGLYGYDDDYERFAFFDFAVLELISHLNIKPDVLQLNDWQTAMIATVYKGNIIKNLIMDCQSYTKYRPNETTGGIFVSWRRKEELPTGA